MEYKLTAGQNDISKINCVNIDILYNHLNFNSNHLGDILYIQKC